MVENLLVISATSDIGISYCKHSFSRSNVIGTFRTHVDQVESFCNKTLYLDVGSNKSINDFIVGFSSLSIHWDRLLICPCQPDPYDDFFAANIDTWTESFNLNSLNQLRLLHSLYRFRANNSRVLFFAGGGTNGAVKSFSAYTSSKIHLIKMVELLDAENNDMIFSILGPGWVNTKNHQNVFLKSSPDSEKYKETLSFIRNPVGATPMEAVMKSIDWIFSQPKEIVGGRNFSSAYDPIDFDDECSELLTKNLASDSDMFKLRRSGNHLFPDKRFNG